MFVGKSNPGVDRIVSKTSVKWQFELSGMNPDTGKAESPDLGFFYIK